MRSDRSRPRYPMTRAEIDAPNNQDIFAVVDPIKHVIYRNRAASVDANIVRIYRDIQL